MKTIQELRLKFRYHQPPPTLKILYEGTEVAELKRETPGYRFRYLDAFSKLDLEPLPGLPLGREYRDTALPLYFRERLPDTKRLDVKRLIAQFNIPTDDELLLLGTLGRHTITDPFELRLSSVA
ncbi:MAG TPA: HipA N-terminal domain-containing protein [Candidatus Sulfotelmatobacter sp.]|nr:HipA N-terminal domain-containing protein [Candidatus Sulfotelmatobacter sp.]